MIQSLKGFKVRVFALVCMMLMVFVGSVSAVPYDLTSSTTAATDGGEGILNAATSAFNTMWPKIVALIAVVFLAFWVINRVRKGATGAK